MNIEVVVNEKDSTKKKGDLLEKMAGHLLLNQNHEILEREVRLTGVELDLVCAPRTNKTTKILVECKAYNEKKKIEAEVIYKLAGIRDCKKYHEAWLISTSELTKDAKGAVQEIEEGEKGAYFRFYTPEKLIEAFINGKVIADVVIVKNLIIELIKNEHGLGDISLWITEYGYYWAINVVEGGKPAGIVFTHSDAKIVSERNLLQNLSETDSSLKDLNFFKVFEYVQEKKNDHSLGANSYKLSKKYLEKINDLNVMLVHPGRSNLTVEDVFVYPDLQYSEEGNSRKINSKKLLNRAEYCDHYIIFGEDTSGKTTLALRLQRDLSMTGYMPVYLSAADIRHSELGKFSHLVVANIKKQYGVVFDLAHFQDFYSENKGKFILIIDDLDLLAIKLSESREAFFKMVDEHFGPAVLLANSSMEIEVMITPQIKNALSNPILLKIKQFGHVLRNELIEKWLMVDKGETVSDNEFFNRKDEITKTIKGIVGTNFIPTHPIYLLTLFQVIESGTGAKFQGSSYAEFYRYLINNALGSVNVRPDDLDFYLTYLSFIAFNLFNGNKKDLTGEDLMGIYNDYSTKMDVDKDFSHTHDILVKSKILKVENERYLFSQQYFYYFFVAKYLADNIDDSTIYELINTISEHLHKNENANVVLFLIHHSKNQKILNKILSEARRVFRDILPSSLVKEELHSINKLIQSEMDISLEEKDPNTYRHEELAMQDEIEDKNASKETDSNVENGEVENLSVFGKIELAFRFMDILGQITKNHYGSLEGERKMELVEEVHSLGFRSLHALLHDFENYISVLRTNIIDLIEKKSSSFGLEKEEIADQIIYSFTEAVSMVFVKRVSDCIASKNLFPTSKKVANKQNTPASILTDLAVKLNFPDQLKASNITEIELAMKGNYLARGILKLLVLEHLYKFKVAYDEKQRICTMLGINIKQNPLYIAKK